MYLNFFAEFLMQTFISTNGEKGELLKLKTSVAFPTQTDFAKPGGRSTAA